MTTLKAMTMMSSIDVLAINVLVFGGRSHLRWPSWSFLQPFSLILWVLLCLLWCRMITPGMHLGMWSRLKTEMTQIQRPVTIQRMMAGPLDPVSRDTTPCHQTQDTGFKWNCQCIFRPVVSIQMLSRAWLNWSLTQKIFNNHQWQSPPLDNSISRSLRLSIHHGVKWRAPWCCLLCSSWRMYVPVCAEILSMPGSRVEEPTSKSNWWRKHGMALKGVCLCGVRWVPARMTVSRFSMTSRMTERALLNGPMLVMLCLSWRRHFTANLVQDSLFMKLPSS